MITYPSNKLQKVLLSGECIQNGTPTPDNPVDIICNNGAVKVSPNLFNKNNLPERIFAYFKSTGTVWTQTDLGYSLRFPCLPNTTYTARYNGNSTQAVLSFASTNNDNIPTSSNQTVTVTQAIRQNSPTINTPITLTTGADDKWLIIQYNVAEPQNTDMADNLQIEQGSMATAYYSYGQIYTDGTQEIVTDNLGNTANAEMLLSVGDYKDKQSILDGSVTRNVGVYVFDGTEDWADYGTFGNNTYRFSVAINSTTDANSSLCTHINRIIQSNTTLQSDRPCIRFSVSGTNIHIYTTDNTTTLVQWKQFLADQYNAGTPVIIVYPLATPTTEQVTPQSLAGNSVTQTAGSINNLPIIVDTHINLKHRFITDSNGKLRIVNKIYKGSNLIWKKIPHN